MTSRSLRTCSRCGRRFSVTLWQMHAHNPERLPCSDAACGEGAVGYCADDPLQQGLGPLCGAHLVEHRRWGHDVRFVDGGVCTVCNGRGRVPDAANPGGPWVRCPGCQGTGYASEQALSAQRRRAAERERKRIEAEEGRRREQEARERLARDEDDGESSHTSTDEPTAATEGAERAVDARAGQTQHKAAGGGSEEERRERSVEEQEDRGEEEAARAQSSEPLAEGTGERSQVGGGGRAGSEAHLGAYLRETRTHRRSPDRHRCCCLVFLVLLIAGIGVGGYHYWPTAGQDPQSEPPPTPTSVPTARVTPGATPTPTPSPSPIPTSTPTAVPCADPTATPTPTATPDPTATPTPGWPPQPLSDAWRDWVRGWGRPQVDAALQGSIRVFEEGLDGLEDLSKGEACARSAAFEEHLEIAQHLVEAHRLGNENVPGQHAGISWVVWLRFQRELLVDAVRTHTPVAECRSLFATPTPTATPASAPTLPAPDDQASLLPACPTAMPSSSQPQTTTDLGDTTGQLLPQRRPSGTVAPACGYGGMPCGAISVLRTARLSLQ